MSTIERWIGSDGTVLIPLGVSADNSDPMISDSGEYFFPMIQAVMEDFLLLENGDYFLLENGSYLALG